jgi:hypothetical protein
MYFWLSTDGHFNTMHRWPSFWCSKSSVSSRISTGVGRESLMMLSKADPSSFYYSWVLLYCHLQCHIHTTGRFVSKGTGFYFFRNPAFLQIPIILS